MAKTPQTAQGSKPASQTSAGRNALVLVAVVIAGAVLYWLADILTPLALAIFLLLMIESFTQVLRTRAKLPDFAALSLALAILVAAFLVSAWIIADNGWGFIDQLKGYAPRLNRLIADVFHLVGQRSAPTVEQLLDRLKPMQYLGLAADGFRGFVATTAFVLIYLAFLIAARAGFHRKWVMLFPSRDERHHAVVVFERLRTGVVRYLWTQSLAGLMIASIAWVVMTVVGLDNAFFWAFLIFITGYIPIIGPLVGATMPSIFALGQFDNYLPAVELMIALNINHATIGTFVLPRMQGKSLNVDPVVLLLSLAFWGKVWGLPGAFLATPLAVAIMVVLSQFQGTNWIAVLISGDGDPLNQAKTQKNQTPDET